MSRPKGAIHFDGDRRLIRAAKSDELRGSASGEHSIRWALTYRDGGRPMIFLPEQSYETRLPAAFLECETARLKLGPVWTPPMTIVCLRFGGHDYRLNSALQLFRAKGAWKDYDWHFASAQAGVRIHGRIHAAPEDFVSLTYYNPPGGMWGASQVWWEQRAARTMLHITHSLASA